MRFFTDLFTWWNDRTFGTWFFTRRKGEKVGEDDKGNVYYKERKGTRRWVIYNGYADASKIPPGWHAWMHYRTDEVPGDYTPRAWQKPHQENLTGTPAAYRPPGSILQTDPQTPARPDYEPWNPEKA